ncbi:MAG: CDP-glucose 4,6-dehydratase [Niabella sp.]
MQGNLTNIDRVFDGVFKNRKILVTGHTGFKGAWLSLMLNKLGADIYGYALKPPTNPSLYEEANIDNLLTSEIGDVQDFSHLLQFVQEVAPEIVIHMAAQPLVRDSYKLPIETYAVNVMGTVHLLEACRQTPGIKAIVNVTTDKCYENKEWLWGYRENEPMGGYDPYSNSKGCSELVTSAYRNSYFNPFLYDAHGVALASARAGNVIGGGDWANDRLIPDFIRSIRKGEAIKIRNPNAIRPWQHVLEPLTGYLMLAAKLFAEGAKYAEGWNFGPDEDDAKNVEWITKTLCGLWGNQAVYEVDKGPHPHEAKYLKLDCSKAKTELGWHPHWDILKTLSSIVDWNKSFFEGKNMRVVTEKQIEDYFK